MLRNQGDSRRMTDGKDREKELVPLDVVKSKLMSVGLLRSFNILNLRLSNREYSRHKVSYSQN